MKKFLSIIICGICLLSLAACGRAKEPESNPLDAGGYDAEGNFIQLNWYPDAAMNNLDENKWEIKDGLRYYNGKEKVTRGIDVSAAQGVIDWYAVKEAGIDFAILRAGYRRYGAGIIEADTNFYYNLKTAKEAGIKVGAYFFSQAVNEEEAEEEAEFTIYALGGEELDLPVYFDTEPIEGDSARTDGLTGEQLTRNAIAFYKKIQDAGYQGGIYASQMWLCNHLDYMALENYDIWLAKYTEELNYPYRFHLWQYSESGSVPGIETAVDLNVCVE